ncbi:DnaJ domain protein [Pseudomonas syringae pv. delphinii]|uniref:DnaJ domain protein n=2 Tax=Pseudomonas syringae pv. delphinii TaxID=192088 RepID=A0A3M4BSI9_9PSED|nr:DnaJ domain protein [Pseudomonas syringae pv. delphinii]RMQ29233.1 DnaJ domain protein [Pseudomonas syringae pv. delphinii]
MTAMDCWSVLNIERDADERSIKRQYARLLKTTRPDDDPSAFQNLRDAYEQALSRARSRVDDEEEDDGNVSWSFSAQEHPSTAPDEAAQFAQPEHRQELPVHDNASPVTRPAIELSWYEQALRTTPDNLHAQRQIAQNQGCDELFQQHLVKRCLLDPEDNLPLIKAAVEQLHWLTPWQKVQLRAHQSQRLTQALLDSSLPQLRTLLENNEERTFLETLKTFQQQPWLASFDRQEQLEQWVMTLLLNNHDWSPALFERLSNLFAWDQKHDVYSGPMSLWMNLVQRCEEKAFIARQQKLLAGAADTPEAAAAHLILQPPALNERLRMARLGDQAFWQACETLTSDLTHRFAQALHVFAHADLQSWRKLPKKVSFNPYLRTYLFISLATLTTVNLNPPTTKDWWNEVLSVVLTFPVFAMLAFHFFMSAWRPASRLFSSIDARYSKHLLPDFLSWPGHQALLLRHGIPVLLFGAAFTTLGPLITLLYVSMVLLWIILSPYRMSLFQDAVSQRTGGWGGIKAFAARNTFKGLMILMGLMLTFVGAVIAFGPARVH